MPSVNSGVTRWAVAVSRRLSDIKWFVLYFVVVLGLGVAFGIEVVPETWPVGEIISVIGVPPAFDGVSEWLSSQTNVELAASALFGLYFGIVGVIAVDKKRSVSGISIFLISVVVALSISYIPDRKILLTNIPPTRLNILVGAICFFIPCAWAAYIRWFTNIRGPRLRHDTTARGYLAFCLLVMLGLSLEAFLLGKPAVALEGVLAAAAVSVPLHRFLSYKSTKRISVVGPSQSGKTLLLAGLHMQSKRKTDIRGGIEQIYDKCKNQSKMDDGKNWPGGETRVEKQGVLEYERSREFPRKRISMGTVDYDGNDLDQIRNRIKNWSATDRVKAFKSNTLTIFNNLKKKIKEEYDSNDVGFVMSVLIFLVKLFWGKIDISTIISKEAVAVAIPDGGEDSQPGENTAQDDGVNLATGDDISLFDAAANIRMSDVVVYLVDPEKLSDDDTHEFNAMGDIFEKMMGEDCAQIVAVTKSDRLYREQDRSNGDVFKSDYLPDCNDEGCTSVDPGDHEWIHEATIKEFYKPEFESADPEVYFVGYQTEENDKGKLIPKRNEQGEMVGVGMEELFDAIDRNL